MAENELQELINGIFSRIKEKYGYTDEQALIYLQGCQDCAEENQKSLEKRDKMLRDTVAELVEAKRLLKLAVEDMYNSVNDVHCKYCSKWHTDQCQRTSHLDCYIENKFKWRYADEALNLIGGSENG